MLTTDTFTVWRPERTRDAHGHEIIGEPAEIGSYAGHAMPERPLLPDVDRGQVPTNWIVLLVPGADVRRGDRLTDTRGRAYVVGEGVDRDSPTGATDHVRVVTQRVTDGATTP